MILFAALALDARAEEAPFYVTVSTHVEHTRYLKDRALFRDHAARLRWAMDLFDEYGAKLTAESELVFSRACARWGDNVLREVVFRGHGVGTHANFGIEEPPLSASDLRRRFAESKRAVDALVGAEHNKGVSGGHGTGEWVVAAASAGFEYIGALTGYAYLSMPMDARPAGWDDAYIRRVAWHEPAPVGLAARLHPFELRDARDFVPDPDGVLTVSAGGLGMVASLEEGADAACAPDCPLDEGDVAALRRMLAEARAARDPARVAKVHLHLPVRYTTPADERVLRAVLAEIDALVDAGVLTWATEKEAWEGYMAW